MDSLTVFPNAPFQSERGITTVTLFKFPLDSGTKALDLSAFELQEKRIKISERQSNFFILLR